MNEEWKKLFKQYEISNTGKIRNAHTKKILTFFESNGYLRIKLRNNDNILKHHQVARLVAEAFLVKPNDKFKNEVDHIDRNRKNNNVTNLRYLTRKENAANKGNIIDRNKRLETIKNIMVYANEGKNEFEIYTLIYDTI